MPKRKNTDIKKDRNKFILIFIIVISIILMLVFEGLYINQHNQLKKWPTEQNADVNLNSDLFSINIKSVNRSNLSMPGFTLNPGDTFLIVNLSITNKTKTSQQFYPYVQSFIRGNTGVSYTMSPTILRNPLQAGFIKPGSSVNGQLSYEVPSNIANPRLFVDLNWQESVPIVFNL